MSILTEIRGKGLAYSLTISLIYLAYNHYISIPKPIPKRKREWEEWTPPPPSVYLFDNAKYLPTSYETVVSSKGYRKLKNIVDTFFEVCKETKSCEVLSLHLTGDTIEHLFHHFLWNEEVDVYYVYSEEMVTYTFLGIETLRPTIFIYDRPVVNAKLVNRMHPTVVISCGERIGEDSVDVEIDEMDGEDICAIGLPFQDVSVQHSRFRYSYNACRYSLESIHDLLGGREPQRPPKMSVKWNAFVCKDCGLRLKEMGGVLDNGPPRCTCNHPSTTEYRCSDCDSLPDDCVCMICKECKKHVCLCDTTECFSAKKHWHWCDACNTIDSDCVCADYDTERYEDDEDTPVLCNVCSRLECICKRCRWCNDKIYKSFQHECSIVASRCFHGIEYKKCKEDCGICGLSCGDKNKRRCQCNLCPEHLILRDRCDCNVCEVTGLVVGRCRCQFHYHR